MPGTQELTRRIKSVKSTRKITRALQMVSAAKMRKAQAATLASRTYADLAWELITNLRKGVSTAHPLLETYPDAKKIGVIIISTNRGMVGGFNANLLSKLKSVEETEPDVLVDLIVIGKKVREASARLKKNISAEFPKLDTTISVADIYPLARMVADAYKSGEYQKIIIIYNHFVSTLVQTATVKQVLPFQATGEAAKTAEEGNQAELEYLFEPSPDAVVEHLIPRIIESQIYQSILESDASEHSARMVMMKNATDNAADLIDDLTLTYNQLRQNKITTELSEITASRIALEADE